MADPTFEELQRAIDGASAAGDQQAVDVLTGEQERIKGLAPAPTGALAPPVVNGGAPALSQETAPPPDVATPALSQPAPPVTGEARKTELAQSQYDADQALIQNQNDNPDDFDWDARNAFLKTKGMKPESDSQQVVFDPKTEEWRLTALSPADMRAVEEDGDSLGNIARGVPGLLTGTVIDQVGNSLSRMDAEQENLQSMQSVMWENMTNPERKRFREEVARMRTAQGEARLYKASDIEDTMITGKLTPQMFKGILDQNPEARDELFDRITGDEEEVAFSEKWRRAANRVSAVVPYMKQNVFGAEETLGDISGFGQYQGLDAKFERLDKEKPLFPGASGTMDDWLDTAEREGATMGQVYRAAFAEPFEAFGKELTGEDRKFGEMVHLGADKIREVTLTEELAADLEVPVLPEGTEWRDFWKAETWTDPNTALPWNNLSAFTVQAVQQVPYILEAIVPARVLGKAAARLATREMAGRSLTAIERYRKTYATIGGGAGGFAAEGAMIYDQVYSETSEALNAVPLERLRKDPQFLALVGSGMSEEQAKQMLIQDASRAAGKAGFIWAAGVLGTPMGMLWGRSAAGSLLKKAQAARLATAALGEPVQEAGQEGTETLVSDIQIKKIDPENPIFSEKGRYEKSMVSGAVFGSMMSVPSTIGALSPENPVGYEKEDVGAARGTAEYMDARNERFKLEFAISDPVYIRATDPMVRLMDMNRLEKLQVAEADAIIAMEADVRTHLETRSASSSSEAELKMLDALVMSANAMKTDIAVARSRRQTAAEMATEQQVIMEERTKIQANVNESITALEDVTRVASNIEKIQKFEAIDEASMEELAREGYARTNKDGNQVVLPKGKRALKEMMRQKTQLEGRIESGYTGAERRNQENRIKRELVDTAGPADREQLLYEDSLTGVQNRRAFNERVQNIDERDESRQAPSKAKAVAAVDVDNLKWVNDNMGEHAVGDKLLLTISDALQAQKGVEVYRLGGDEFAVTGESEEALEAAMQNAKKELQDTPVSNQTEEVIPQLTWATGPDYRTADKKAVAVKNDRKERGLTTNKETGRPVTHNTKTQGQLFQKLDEGESVLQKARDGDSNAQEVLRKFGLEWDGNKPKYRRVGKGEVDRLLAGEEVKSSRQDSGITDITDNPEYAKVPVKSDHRITFKTTDKFDSDLGKDSPIRLKNKKAGEYHLTGGYSISDIQTIEQRQADGTWKEVYESTEQVDGNLAEDTQTAQEPRLSNKWRQVRDEVQRGDSVEILTPDGATYGIITNITNRRGRPRIRVSVQGRSFYFNPDLNHLILNPRTSLADVAWITGDPEWVQPGRQSFPQTVEYINIGHFARDGKFYADIGPDALPVRDDHVPWQKNLLPNYIWGGGPWVKPKLPQLSKDDTYRAMAVLDNITKGNNNLPPITMVTNLEKKTGLNAQGEKVKIPEEVMKQIKGEGASITGVRGYFDHINPDNGLFIFATNINKMAGEFEQGIGETTLHELIGHYGVRGIFGDERALRIEMHNIVDRFPKLARHYEIQLSSTERQLSLKNAADKQLIGEEMIAYLAGQVLSGKVNFNAQQKTAWERLMMWFRDLLVRRGWNKWSPVKKLQTKIEAGMSMETTKEMFWNDQKIQELLFRSMDFVRNGKGFEFRTMTDDAIRSYNLRDADIFQAGLITAIMHGTKKATNNEKNQLVQQGKYASKGEVPSEIPLFPESGSPNVYRQAVVAARKLNLMSQREVTFSALEEIDFDKAAKAMFGKPFSELDQDLETKARLMFHGTDYLALDKDQKREVREDNREEQAVRDDNFAFFRDATYKDLMKLSLNAAVSSGSTDLDRHWYRNVLPQELVTELDAIYEALDKNQMIGPMAGHIGSDESKARAMNFATWDAANHRIDEILAMTMNQKKTRLNKGLLISYMESSDRVLRVTVMQDSGHQEITYEDAARRLLGADVDMSNISVMGEDMIKRYQKDTKTKGADVGYNEQTKTWLNHVTRSTKYRQYTPIGHKKDDDYRVVLIRTAGSGADMYRTGDDHFKPNLLHLRTGVAEYIDVGGEFVVPDAPNPANQGKFLAMIEMQSDWLQHLRKNYATDKDARDSKRAAMINPETLLAVGDKFVGDVAGDLWNHIDAALKPIANLPDGSLSGELNTFATELNGKPYADLDVFEKHEAWKQFTVKKMDDLYRSVDAMLEPIDLFLAAQKGLGDKTAGTMDARMFERLDTMAAAVLAKKVRVSVLEAKDAVYNTLRYADDQADLVKKINEFKRTFFLKMKSAIRSDHQAMLRLPLAGHALKEMFTPLYEALGADTSGLNTAIEGLATRETATIRIPVKVVRDFATASIDSDQPIALVRDMFSATSLLDAGVQPNTLSISFSEDVPGFVDVQLVGEEDAFKALDGQLSEIISGWVTKQGPIKRENSKSAAERRAAERNQANLPEPEWEQIEEEWVEENIDAGDTDLSQADETTLRDNGVQTYEQFEEGEFEDVHDENVRYAFENYDWEANGDYHRDSTEYRELIVVDDDGDADTSAAEEWLENGRDEVRDDLTDDDEIRSQTYTEIREKWESESTPLFITGYLPTSWDEDGDPDDSVQFMIKNVDHGDSYDVYIDDDRRDYFYDLDEAKASLISEMKVYYENERITPPQGKMFGPDLPQSTPAAEAAVTEESQPNWKIVANNIVDSTAVMSGNAIKMSDTFSDMVKGQAKLDGRQEIIPNSPLGADKDWRTIGLKYLIADAVRRGFPGIIWAEGLSSKARGGWHSLDGVTRVERLTWTQEKMEIRGETMDVIVINSPDLRGPLVVAPDKMITILGTKLTSFIYQQMKGNIPNAPNVVVAPEGEQFTLFDGKKVNPRDSFLISTTPSGTYAIHRRSDNTFVSFARDEAEMNEAVKRAYATLPEAQAANNERQESELLGEVLASGEVNTEMFGAKMNIIVGDEPYRYEHTFGQTKPAGARESYEKITVSIWNNELKKYGAKVERTTIQVNDIDDVAHSEGLSVTRVKTRDAKVKAKHGALTVEELTGESHGWVIISQNEGPVNQSVFSSRARAEEELTSFIEYNFGNDKGGSEVFFIPINEAMIEAFSGPVAPFHYNPSEDPELKEVFKRFGAELPKKSFSERWNKFSEEVHSTWQQGLFDQFHGIKRAMRMAGIEVSAQNDPYIMARLSTSMDSMMKAALLYGHPVWKEGIVQNEGKGLAEIFRPIMSDTKPWEAWMYSRRAKRLMLEGYESLTVGEKILIDKAARHFGGDRFEAMLFVRSRVAAESLKQETAKDRKKDKSRTEILAEEAIANLQGDIAKAREKAKMTFEQRDLEFYGAPWTQEKIDEELRNPDPDMSEADIRAMGRTTAERKAGIKRRITKLEQDIAAKKQRRGTPVPDGVLEGLNNKLTGLKALLNPEAIIPSYEAAIKRQEKRISETTTKKQSGWAKGNDADAATDAFARMVEEGREHRFPPEKIAKMLKLGDHYPVFQRVADDWEVYNKAVLDFAEAAGTINKESRKVWDVGDYVPFHTVSDDKFATLAGGRGIANVKSPVQRLFGSSDGDLDIVHNIMTKTTTLMEGAVKNHAALMAVDTLKGSGTVAKAPAETGSAIVPMSEVKKHMISAGMDPKTMDPDMLEGVRKMMTLNAPSGPNILSVLRDGKREYYETTDPILFRAMTAINKQVWDNPLMTALRAPKRFFTTVITTDPAFQGANFTRDTGSAFVLARDPMIPVVSAIVGFKQALLRDESYRVLLGAGAAFENGYVTAGDPKRTRKILKRAMRSTSFKDSVLDTPRKAWEAYKALGSAIENANRIAIYNAAIAAGKSKAQAVFEAKDVMDFTMGGDWPVVQFLIQTVPFMGARMQGLHRLGRGFVENPAAFTLKASLLTVAALALWYKNKDDERYKALEEWDKDTYLHWWVGDKHYRLPRPFEIGALFMTIPERIAEAMYSEENDNGKLLLDRLFHMFTETFNMNPIPQAVRPMVEMAANHNFFTDRDIVSYYEEKRLPTEQRRYYTSPTMIALSSGLPKSLDTVLGGRLRSPLHLQNFYMGYTAAMGRYGLMASDWAVRRAFDLPLPPAKDVSDWPVVSRFYRGESQVRRTKYEQVVYDLLDKTTAIQGSLNFLAKEASVRDYLETYSDYKPYIVASKSLESIRESVQDINRAQMALYMSTKLTPDEKKVMDDKLQETKNKLFKTGYELRPGGKFNPVGKEPTDENIIDLIDDFGVNNSPAALQRLKEEVPDTHAMLKMITESMDDRGLESLAKLGEQ